MRKDIGGNKIVRRVQDKFNFYGEKEEASKRAFQLWPALQTIPLTLQHHHHQQAERKIDGSIATHLGIDGSGWRWQGRTINLSTVGLVLARLGSGFLSHRCCCCCCCGTIARVCGPHARQMMEYTHRCQSEANVATLTCHQNNDRL